MRARHADIGDVGGATRQNALIGGGHVRVRAEHGGNFPGEIPTHGLFFGSGLCVHVHNNHFDIGRKLCKLALCGAKRIVQCDHERAALKIQHGVTRAIFGVSDVGPLPRRAFGEICRANQPRFVREEIYNFFTIPHMISASDNLHAAGE